MQTTTMKLRWHGKSAHVPLSFVLFALFSSNVCAQSFTDSINAYANSISSRIAKSWENFTDRGELTKAYTAYKQQDYATALKYLRPLAQHGQGVSKDLKQAASWYRKSATQGNAAAQSNLSALEINREISPPLSFNPPSLHLLRQKFL